MNLDRVTMTGADDSVFPESLANLSGLYPFVEWGILASRSSTGSPRFPSLATIKDIQRVAKGRKMKLCLHLCGHWVRQLLLGVNELPDGVLDEFQRVQLNFHAERTHCDPTGFAKALRSLGQRQIIFQIDGDGGNEHLQSVHEIDDADDIDAVGLFDNSGGAGILPGKWPEPYFTQNDIDYAYQGYAGGLGPDNLSEQLPLIDKAAKGARIWIDMETKVRSLDDRQFDMKKVKACLEICKPFVKQTPAANGKRIAARF
jgi:hypothetical protein